MWAIGTYFLLVLQTTLGPSIAIGPFLPNLLIAFCVPCFCCGRSRRALCGAAVWGLAVDAMGSGPLGINLISFTLIAALFRPQDERQVVSTTRIIFLTALAVLPLTTLQLAAQWPLTELASRWSELIIYIAGNALYTMSVGLLVIISRLFLLHVIGRVRGDNRRNSLWGRAALRH